jgi:type VI secretion system protein ImpH
MATEGRTKNPGVADSSLEEILREDPCSFEFFQAVTLLQRLRENCQAVGRFSNPQNEAVRFVVNNQLAFPASQIQGINWPDKELPHLTVNFMGLTGPLGVLPYSYSELMLERMRAKDGSLQDFFDIFNHRMISFFYRAWEKYRFPVTYCLGEEDRFTQRLLDFVGMGMPGLQDRQAMPDEALLHYVGLLGLQARSAAALEQILEDYFEVPVEVEQFVGAWYRLDPESQSQVEDGDSVAEQLGVGVVVGDEVWDQQSRVRVKLGPMGLERYHDFLPEGSAYEPLRAFTRFFSNDEFDFEIELILKREDVPECSVGTEGQTAPQLGWVSWLKSKPFNREACDTILSL